LKTGVRGDAIVVNGKTWPELAVTPTNYYPFDPKAGPGYVRHSWTTKIMR
jgi:hypothetical protein